jgi:hypothetical protein
MPTHQEHAAVPVPIPTRGLQKSSRISTSRRLDQLSIALTSREGCILQEKKVSGIHNFLDKDKDSLQFVISRPTIVNDVVGDLFFHPEEDEEDDASEPIMKANAMKLFKPQEDGSYLVTIKNSL